MALFTTLPSAALENLSWLVKTVFFFTEAEFSSSLGVIVDLAEIFVNLWPVSVALPYHATLSQFRQDCHSTLSRFSCNLLLQGKMQSCFYIRNVFLQNFDCFIHPCVIHTVCSCDSRTVLTFPFKDYVLPQSLNLPGRSNLFCFSTQSCCSKSWALDL